MLRTLLCDNNNHFLVITDLKVISELIQHKDHHLWLDIEAPTPDEFKMIEEEFGLHPLAIEDASVRHQRPKVDQYSNFYFVVFYAVDLYEAGNDQTSVATDGVRRGLRGTRFHGQEGGKPNLIPNARYEPGSLIGSAPENGNAQEDAPSPQPQLQTDNLAAISGSRNPQGAPAAGRGGQILLQELSMFMGKNYLITAHQQPIVELDEVARRWYRNVAAIRGELDGKNSPAGTRPLTDAEAKSLNIQDDGPGHHTMIPAKLATAAKANGNSDAEKRGPAVGAGPDEVDESFDGDTTEKENTNDVGILLYSLLDTIVDGYFPVIDTIVDRIEDLEEEIFEHFNQGAIESVFNLKKDLLALRKVLAPERDVLNILTRRDLPLFEQHTLVYFQDVYDHVVRITDSIDTYRDLLSSALDSYLSMQSNRLNITVQTLTSVSIMLMTIATFTGWYGMNFENMPELHTTYGYYVLAVVVISVIAVELFFFRRKGWL